MPPLRALSTCYIRVVTTGQTLITAEQFLEMPEPRDGGKMELVRGEVVWMSPVGAFHSAVARRIGAWLGLFADANRLGAVGVEGGFRLAVNPDTVLGPDVHFTEQLPIVHPQFVEGPPTLAVEVVSPNDRDSEVQGKVDAYLAAGSARVWVARPEQRTVTVFRADGTVRVARAGDVLTSDDAAFAVDGFELAVGDIFAS